MQRDLGSPYDNIPGKIFIGGIHPVTSQETIQKYFEKYGELCDCVLMQDKGTGKSRGFGFVTYKNPHAVDDVLTVTHFIDGKEVDCKRAIPRDQQNETTKEDGSYRTKKLFVGGIPQNQFKKYFEQFGKVEDSVIMVDKETGKSRGFGFVTFDNEDSVEKVIQRYNDNKIEGKWVECKRAQPKEVNQGSSKSRGYKNEKSSSSNQNYYGSSNSGGTSQKSQKHSNTQENNQIGYYGSNYSQNTLRNNYDTGYSLSGTNASQTGYSQVAQNYAQNYNPNLTAYNQNYGVNYQSVGYSNPYNTAYGSYQTYGNYQQYQAQTGYGQAYDPQQALGTTLPNSTQNLTQTISNPTPGASKIATTNPQTQNQLVITTQSSQSQPQPQTQQQQQQQPQSTYNQSLSYSHGYIPYVNSADTMTQASYLQYVSQPNQQQANQIYTNQSNTYSTGSTQISGSSTLDDQGGVGPIKGPSKKQNIEQRFYQPY